MTLRKVGALAAVVVLLDQLSKWWALTELPGKRIDLLGDWLGLQLVFNSGAALSIGAGYTVILTILAVAMTVIIIRFARKTTSPWWLVVAGLVLGGAIGNLIDRLFRPPGFATGHVVDFIDYGGLFVGNVADIAIVVGAGMVIWASLRGNDPFKKPAADDEALDEDVTPEDAAPGDAARDDSPPREDP